MLVEVVLAEPGLCWGQFGGSPGFLSGFGDSDGSLFLVILQIRPVPKTVSSSTPAASTNFSEEISEFTADFPTIRAALCLTSSAVYWVDRFVITVFNCGP
jgi:hypothetical protein